MDQIEEELKCSDGTCGHKPQFDDDLCHPNKTLATALRQAQAEIEKVAEAARDNHDSLLMSKERIKSLESSLAQAQERGDSLFERATSRGEAYESVWKDKAEKAACPQCGGQGWYTGSEHDGSCDGGCEHCPVPVQIECDCQHFQRIRAEAAEAKLKESERRLKNIRNRYCQYRWFRQAGGKDGK